LRVRCWASCHLDYSPGIILQDIVIGLVRASVVIAEITPVNANVFYELGYAHCARETDDPPRGAREGASLRGQRLPVLERVAKSEGC